MIRVSSDGLSDCFVSLDYDAAQAAA